jgi:diguanylate cyclase (GGDEF)-like protein
VIPLVFNTGLVGALAVYGQDAGCFNDDHRRLMARVAEQAAGVIANSITYEETKRDSLTDPLTGLPNTRFMFVHLTRELARAERLKSEVSLLVMDLDNFKEINDSFGHAAGDRALREVARVLRAGIRPYDICVRYAGDEFVVLLSGCGPEEAQIKMLELQAGIDALMIEVRPGRLVRLGASFGCASFPADGHGYETLLSMADERMYDDKARRKALASDQTPPLHTVDAPGGPSVFAKIDRPTGPRMH